MQDVPDGEDSRDARLQQHGRSCGREPSGLLPVMAEIVPRKDASPSVAFDALREPCGPRLCSDEDEDRRRGDGLRSACLDVPQGQPLQAGPTVAVDHLNLVADADVRGDFQSLDQIIRHALRERRAPDEERHVLRRLGKVHRGLSDGVPTADHEDVFALHRRSFGHGCAEEDPCAAERIEVRDADAAIAHADGEDERSRHHPLCRPPT